MFRVSNLWDILTWNGFFLGELIGNLGIGRREHSILPTLIWSVVEKISIDNSSICTRCKVWGLEFSFNMPSAIHTRCGSYSESPSGNVFDGIDSPSPPAF